MIKILKDDTLTFIVFSLFGNGVRFRIDREHGFKFWIKFFHKINPNKKTFRTVGVCWHRRFMYSNIVIPKFNVIDKEVRYMFGIGFDKGKFLISLILGAVDYVSVPCNECGKSLNVRGIDHSSMPCKKCGKPLDILGQPYSNWRVKYVKI